MKKNLKLAVEQFDRGITVRCEGGDIDTKKRLAVDGEEFIIIGKMIWDEVTEFMESLTADKVTVDLTLTVNPDK